MFEQLPAEINLMIFSYLDVFEIYDLKCTCRKFFVNLPDSRMLRASIIQCLVRLWCDKNCAGKFCNLMLTGKYDQIITRIMLNDSMYMWPIEYSWCDKLLKVSEHFNVVYQILPPLNKKYTQMVLELFGEQVTYYLQWCQDTCSHYDVANVINKLSNTNYVFLEIFLRHFKQSEFQNKNNQYLINMIKKQIKYSYSLKLYERKEKYVAHKKIIANRDKIFYCKEGKCSHLVSCEAYRRMLREQNLNWAKTCDPTIQLLCEHVADLEVLKN